MSTNMDRGAIIASLIGAYENNKSDIPLLDEDFAPSPSGEWVKYKGAWGVAIFMKYMDRSLSGAPFIKTWNGDAPKWVAEAQSKHEAFCAEVDAMPKHELITTWEQRMLRHVGNRADEIMKAGKGS